MSVEVKTCGLSTEEAVAAAVSGGARYVGFVFYPPSPRSVTAARAAELCRAVPKEATKVGLFVDAEDALLAQVLDLVPLDLLQFHGKESPERVAEVKASDRLVDSPALALNADKFMSPQMRRMMKAMNKDGADTPLRVNLEINPRSAVMKRLFETHTAAPDKARLVAEQILDNALISAGLLDDATPMVARLYKLLESV